MAKISPIDPFLETQGYVILDGGLATELENRGHDLNHRLWSARLLISNPEQIQEIHMAYLLAGANCLISASYQASIEGFMAEGLSRKKAEFLIKNTVTIAQDARDAFLESRQHFHDPDLTPLIAASIGPYGAYLADGSEYRGRYAVSSAALRSFHQSRWEILAQTSADLFACETIPSLEEAEVLRKIVDLTPEIYVWISFSCIGPGHINDGTSIQEAISLFEGCKQVVAIGVNCTAPRFISSLIKKIAECNLKVPIVVYPNSGEIYDAVEKKWQGKTDPLNFSLLAKEWYKLGAKLIGGCCRTGPEHIQVLRNALSNPMAH